MRTLAQPTWNPTDALVPVELPTPEPRPDEVRVAVKAIGVNPVDWKIRAGDMRILSGRTFPRALGTDFAGVIASVGPGVSGWSVGDAVYGMTVTALGRPGAHADRLAVPASALRRKPENLTFDVAATLPVAALTALNGLRLAGPLDGRSVLVNGATGGVGHFALQIARARGARVTAVCSAANMGLAQALGAAEVFDYRASDITQMPARYDVLYDAFGAMPLGAALRLLTDRGVYVTPLGMPAVMLRSIVQNLLPGKRIRVGNVRSEPEDYAAIEGLLGSGDVRAVIGLTFPLERTGEAFAAAERGGVQGKVVIQVS